MTDFSLKLRLSTDTRIGLLRHLGRRALGSRFRLARLLLPDVAGVAAALGLSAARGLPLMDGLLLAFATLVGLNLANHALGLIYLPRFRKELASSALTSRPVSVHLSALGLSTEAHTYDWRDVVGITRFNGLTLVNFSTADCIPIPDGDLPAGVTPELLAARIAVWKAA